MHPEHVEIESDVLQEEAVREVVEPGPLLEVVAGGSLELLRVDVEARCLAPEMAPPP